MSKSAKKRPTASAPAAVPTTKSSRHGAGDNALFGLERLIYPTFASYLALLGNRPGNKNVPATLRRAKPIAAVFGVCASFGLLLLERIGHGLGHLAHVGVTAITTLDDVRGLLERHLPGPYRAKETWRYITKLTAGWARKGTIPATSRSPCGWYWPWKSSGVGRDDGVTAEVPGALDDRGNRSVLHPPQQ